MGRRVKLIYPVKKLLVISSNCTCKCVPYLYDTSLKEVLFCFLQNSTANAVYWPKNVS